MMSFSTHCAKGALCLAALYYASVMYTQHARAVLKALVRNHPYLGESGKVSQPSVQNHVYLGESGKVSQPSVQNHVYLGENAIGNVSCLAFIQDRDLLASGLNFSRYPWHLVKSHGSRKKVLYGTAFAQKAIWEHQHPANCSDAKFLEFYVPKVGFGSQVHQLGQALALAMHLGRVLLPPPSHHFFWLYDKEFCPGEATWHCWFQNITWCKKPMGGPSRPSRDFSSEQKIVSLEAPAQVPGFDIKSVPEIFRDLLSKCSPIKPDFWFYWWRAQSATYLVRFNQKTRRALDQMRSETLFECQKPLKQEPGTVLEPGTVSATVRGTSKVKEAEIFQFESYLDQAEALAVGNQSIPVLHRELAETSTNFTYPKEAYANKMLLLSTEDPKVLASALKACENSSPWKVIYTKAPRYEIDPQLWLRRGSEIKEMVLVALLNLELALEADSWIGTLTSNTCRLVDELRMTVGMKASNPFLNLATEPFYCQGKHILTCYLDW